MRQLVFGMVCLAFCRATCIPTQFKAEAAEAFQEIQYSALERTMLWNLYDLKIVEN